jgi:hypothetical protein
MHRTRVVNSRLHVWLGAVLSAALLTACGGGGGAGNGAEAPPAPAAKAWQAAALIETNSIGIADTPQIAVAANGDAFAVWAQQRTDGGFDIWANRYTPAAGWGAAELIEDGADNAGTPQVAVDAKGNAMAVWSQPDAAADHIRVNRYVAGVGWSGVELVEQNTAADIGGAQIAMDAAGNAFVVWAQSDGAGFNIWANRYAAGSGWATAQMIEQDDAGDALSPQIAVNPSGNAVAVWQLSGDTQNVLVNNYVAGTGWGTVRVINVETAGAALRPQVAMDAIGNAVAVWEQGGKNTGGDIWASRFTPSTGWGTATLLEQDNVGTAGRPQIAIDATGNAMAVWQQTQGARTNILASRYVLGSGWGRTELVDASDTGDAANPQIAMHASGNAVAVWEQFDGLRSNIVANRYTVGDGWGAAELIENTNFGEAVAPQVGIDASGNALAVWPQADRASTATGRLFDVWANVFR